MKANIDYWIFDHEMQESEQGICGLVRSRMCYSLSAIDSCADLSAMEAKVLSLSFRKCIKDILDNYDSDVLSKISWTILPGNAGSMVDPQPEAGYVTWKLNGYRRETDES
tara:strand:- start:2673 stop:3002 length:330 start_codon:yes stop_codon:yes gene_type:complete